MFMMHPHVCFHEAQGMFFSLNLSNMKLNLCDHQCMYAYAAKDPAMGRFGIQGEWWRQ